MDWIESWLDYEPTAVRDNGEWTKMVVVEMKKGRQIIEIFRIERAWCGGVGWEGEARGLIWGQAIH